MTKSNLIHITSPVPTPFSDNFETGTFATKDWTLINADGQSTWGFSTAASGNGSSATSVWLNFYNYDNSGAIDELVSPGIVIPQSGTVKLKFKVAYRAYSDNYHDSLKVAIYTNCGSSLAGIPYAKGYSDLPTGNDDVNPFTPSVAADWRLDSLDLSAYHGQTIILKFIAVNGYGNNIFLDDINLTTTLGSVIANFSANPTSVCQNGTVSFTDLSVGSPTSWLWNFGDGGTSTLQNPTHQYLSPGYKTVSLTASHTGSSNTHAKNDYIHVNAIPIISLGNDTVIPQSDILTLDAGAGYWAYQWNTGETTQVKQVSSTGTYSVTVASAPGCSGSDAIFVKHGFSDIYGSVSYFNISNSPMDSVLVQLKSGTSVVQSTMVSSGGSFHFTSVSPEMYSLEAFSGKSWGGANATDAMLVLKHFVNIASLSGIKLKAANVDNSAVVNSLDAMLISRRFTGSVSSFPAGNWAFEKPEIVFSGNSDFTQNIKGMCYGDVNGSFFPFSKTSIPQLELQGRAEQDLSGWTLVPLTTDQDLEVGAISMIIDFLSGNYEVSEVKGPACEGSSLDFHFEEGRLNIAWYSLNPVRINAGEPLLVLKVRSLNMASGTFMLQTQSGSELADGNAVAFPEVKLFYPEMSTDDAKALQMRVFPNPSPGVVNLFVEGADNESFRLEIRNMLGEVVYTEPYIVFSSGTKHRLDLSPLPAGLYFLSLKGREMSSFVKIVRQAQDLK